MKSIKCRTAIATLLQLLLIYSEYGSAYKILGIFPSMSKSHFIVGHALMRGLADAGHEVTVLSPYPQNKPVKNYRDIDVQGIHQIIKGTYMKSYYSPVHWRLSIAIRVHRDFATD